MMNDFTTCLPGCPRLDPVFSVGSGQLGNQLLRDIPVNLKGYLVAKSHLNSKWASEGT